MIYTSNSKKYNIVWNSLKRLNLLIFQLIAYQN